MARILVLGAAAMDIIVRVPDFAKTDSIIYPEEIHRVPGGSAANVAVGLARLGAEVSFLGTSGADEDGDAILAAFASENVDTGNFIRHAGVHTAGAFVAVNPSGDRIMYSLGGEALYADASDLDPIDFSADALYIAEAFPAVGTEAARRVHENGGRVFFSPGGVMCAYGLDTVRPIIAVCDTMFVSLSELEALTGRRNAKFGADALLQCGAPAVVVTEGGRGAGIYTQNGFAFERSLPVKVVDTTGAGDAFAAAYLFAELSGHSPEERLRFANRCAAFAVGRFGARTSPRLSELPDVEYYL